MFDLTNRNTFVASIPKGMDCVEVGVAAGAFAQAILDKADPTRLWLIDTWTQQPHAIDPSSAPQEHHSASYHRVREQFRGEERVKVLRTRSTTAASIFVDGSLGFVYIDANHTDVAADIRAWWPKVMPGGILAGHDYRDLEGYFTVKRDVDAFVQREELELLLTREVDEAARSWIVVKPE